MSNVLDRDRQDRGAAIARWGSLLAATLGVAIVVGIIGSSPSDAVREGAAPLQQVTATPASIVWPEVATDCRLVAVLDEVARDEQVVRGRIQNAGGADVTITAVELGWSGDATLQAVEVVGVEGPRTVFDGSAKSPAFLRYSEPVRVQAGRTVELALHFEIDDDGLPWTPQAAVVHTEQGCAAALLAPVEKPCGIEVLQGPARTTERPERVEMVIRPLELEDRALSAIEADWPGATNGPLRSIEIDGTRLERLPGADRPPTTLRLDRLMSAPPRLVPGERMKMAFDFGRPAGQSPYEFTLADTDGCAVTTSTWLAPTDCGIEGRAFDVADDTARMYVSSSSEYTRTIRAVDLFWPTAINGDLLEVTADGRTVWEGAISTSPATIELERPVSVVPDSGVEIRMRFTGSEDAVQVDGSEPSSIARDAYTIVVHTAGGCRTVFTARQTSGECGIAAGQLVRDVERSALRLPLVNMGRSARLRQIGLAWNADNGALTDIRLDDRSLLRQALPHDGAPITVTLPVDMRPAVAGDARSTLWLEFENPPAEGGYGIDLAFETLGGVPCQNLLITRPLVQGPRTCGWSLTDLRVRDDVDLLATLERSNDSEPSGEPVAVDRLTVEWPTAARLEVLRRIDLLAGGDVIPIWEGSALRGPVVVNKPGVALDPETSYVLRLRYAGRIEQPERLHELMRIVVELADGCRIVDREPEAAAPAAVTIEGVLQSPLPEPLLSCCWNVAVSGDSEQAGLVLVEADQRTRIQPDAVTPRVGDMVSIDALKFEDGRLYAEHIRFVRYRRTERIVGTVQSVADSRLPQSGLPEWIVVLQRRVHLAERTQVHGTVLRGSRVIVEGSRNADDSLSAVRIRVAGGMAEPEFVEVSGIVHESTTAQDVAIPDLIQRWSVGRYDVRILRTTAFVGGSMVPGQDPELLPPGTAVRISGPTVPSAGAAGGRITIAAQRVEILELQAPEVIEGVVEEIPTGSLVGEWALRTSGGELRRFQVRSLAIVDTSGAPAAVGLPARVQVRPTGDGETATSVEMEWD